ncbi:hypothetical protein MLD38_023114 [Melastoma candidum]|uniref:Uncharacterized protein n=1 Tax=Melastoma candidum TaxID=119954 RepID=A0ACB9QQE9_9MYRT|nr:hypothetical protein MLD38_023114 [Melastoma candidum]
MVTGVLLLALFCIGCSGIPEKPAVYIFGDSTADVGTNSFLPNSQFRANYPHYGIDFPKHIPTGRFSNGLNAADFIAKLMGLESSPPPFLSINSTSSMKKYSMIGLNFASGGSGILDLTGENVTTNALKSKKNKNVVSLGEQIKQFAAVRGTLADLMGQAAARNYLANCLFFISTGSNDIFSYYLTRSNVPEKEFMSTLGSKYERHLELLISLGARKIGIISVPPIGCCPSQRAMNESGGCLDGLNEQAVTFHSTIRIMMDRINSRHNEIKYSIGNAFNMTMDVLQGPISLFNETKAACCGTGKLNAQEMCNPKTSLCSDRTKYLFWDSFHPTSAASEVAATTLFQGGPRYVYPINFSQLAAA